MPNWNSNVVTFKHSDTAAVKRIADAFATGNFMQQFFPCPIELVNTVSGFATDPADQVKLVEQQQANLAKYGYATWYEWCTSEWGVKWDFGDSEYTSTYSPGDTVITLTFDTAWGPPLEFYAKMVDELGYDIKAYYYEPGMAFCGLWNNHDDTSYKIPETSDEVADCIPSNIDEMFNIAGQMDEWEQVND